MAAPLSGIGQQQQIPLSQPFQPGGSDQTREVRQRNQEPNESDIQSRSAASAQTQKASTDDSASFEDALSSTLSTSSNEQSSAQGRGTVVDITV